MHMKPQSKNNQNNYHKTSTAILKIFKQERFLILAGCFIISLGIVLISTQFGSLFVRIPDFKMGTVAERDFVVDRDIIYIDEKATELKRQAARSLVPPIFRINEEITGRSLAQFDSFREEFLKIMEQESSVEKIFLKSQLTFPGVIDKESTALLVEHTSLSGLFDQARELLLVTLTRGVVNLADRDNDAYGSGSIELWRWHEGRLEKEEYLLEEVLTLSNLIDFLEQESSHLPDQETSLLRRLVEPFAKENSFLDAEQTRKHRQKAMDEVEGVVGNLVEGQVLVRRGDIVSEEIGHQIRAVGKYSTTLNLNSIIGSAIYLTLIFALAVFLLNKKIIKINLKRSQLIFLGATGCFYLLLAALLSRSFQLPEWLPLSIMLPTAAISIVAAIIISTNLGIVFTLLISLLFLPLVKMDISSFLFSLLTGVAGTAVVLKLEKRIDLVWAGAFLALVNSLILITLMFLKGYMPERLLFAVGSGILNGFFSGILSLGFIPIFEHALNAPTRFRLMELSDLNAPPLKKMLSQAPGTYSHSISVANLAESACNSITANALLARVGAYYHDIGKIDQAEYFVENQRSYNKHDDLKPSLSVAVIKSHVKIGIEKAKELNLPNEIIDIIAQHHGKGVIKYFYNLALEKSSARNVSSDDYSYPGNRPKSREAAVVMLADSVEAASRLLKKPNMVKLEKFVGDLIMEKLNNNELSESELTLKDLENIKKSFIQILAGYFHSRLEYPKTREELR